MSNNKQVRNNRAVNAPVEFRLTPNSIEGWFDRLNEQLTEVERDIERLNFEKIQRDITVLKRILKGGGI